MTVFAERPELLAAFRAGDRAALEEVYWHYVGVVERVMRFGAQLSQKNRRIPGVENDAVRDLVQEVFARAFAERARLGFDGLRPFGPYLLQISRNLLVDEARKSGRETALDLESDVLERLAGEHAPVDDPGSDWADADTVALTERYLSGLPAELRDIHEQRFVLGLSQRDAASQLGISRQQLRTREARLCDGLRSLLGRR